MAVACFHLMTWKSVSLFLHSWEDWLYHQQWKCAEVSSSKRVKLMRPGQRLCPWVSQHNILLQRFMACPVNLADLWDQSRIWVAFLAGIASRLHFGPSTLILLRVCKPTQVFSHLRHSCHAFHLLHHQNTAKEWGYHLLHTRLLKAANIRYLNHSTSAGGL